MEGVGEGSRRFQGLQGITNLGFLGSAVEADAVLQRGREHGPVAVAQQAPAGGAAAAAAAAVREQDRLMPVANVIRIMRRVLPTHAKISDDAKETMQECVSEYISFITSEANERCQREQRKTITAEDVLWAMSRLGFEDYIEPLSVFLQHYRQAEGDHRASLRSDLLPIAPLLRHRNDRQPNLGPLLPPMPPPPPPPPMYHHQLHHDDAPMTAQLQMLPGFSTAAVVPPPQMLPAFSPTAVVPPPQHHPFGQMYGGDGILGGYYAMAAMYGSGGDAGDENTSSHAAPIAPTNFDHHHHHHHPYAAFK